jgi:hypothetical protein
MPPIACRVSDPPSLVGDVVVVRAIFVYCSSLIVRAFPAYFTPVHVLYRDFYFRALGSLVVLSFPQSLSFSSVLPKR